MGRLRRVSPRMSGWSRKRSGRGFTYLDADGKKLSPHDVERVKSLVIPPAWNDVWICPIENGHIQAIGTDAAGRRQYLYHPDWRIKQDKLKFERILIAGRRMAKARAQMIADLAGTGMPLSRAAATAGRLLDLGYFRIGSDAYADTNGSFGLTTLERRHVRRNGTKLIFSFVGKSGIKHTVEIDDAPVIDSLSVMRRRRGSQRLLGFQQDNKWSDLDATAVNAYLSALFAEELTAKDFRTWHATVLAAIALADSSEKGDTVASRKRAIKAAVDEVASYLGNTPTIARNSYIDPRVIDRYEAGETIAPTLRRRYRDEATRQASIERAVVRILKNG